MVSILKFTMASYRNIFLENLTSAITSESAFNCDAPKPSCFEAHLITISNDVSKSRVDKG